MDNHSGLTETPKMETEETLQDKSKLIEQISVSKLKKLQKFMKSDEWERLVNMPDYFNGQLDSVTKRTQQLEKTIGDRFKKELNTSKRDELDDFEIHVTESMDLAKANFTKWIKSEEERHEKYMKKLVSDIESKSKHLSTLKDDIVQAEKDFKVQSRLPQYFQSKAMERHDKPMSSTCVNDSSLSG